MTKKEVEGIIRYGSLAAFIGAALCALGLVVAFTRPTKYPVLIAQSLDCLMFIGLGYGLKRKSRVCGLILSGALGATMVGRIIVARSFGVLTQPDIWITVFVM